MLNVRSKPWLYCLLLGVFLLHGAVNGQVPELLAVQGRLQVSGQPLQGRVQFKFALLAGPSDTMVWNHEHGAAVQGEPLSAVELWVTNGLFHVFLGDTTLSNMAALPAEVAASADLRLRIWVNDGAHGWERLAPDCRFASVPFALRTAQTPTNSITLGHLTPAFQGWLTNLAASASTNSLASESLLLATLSRTTNLWQAGYRPLPARLQQQEWQSEFLDPRITSAFLSAPGTNLWDGSRWWLWRWGDGINPGKGACYDPDAGRWTMLATSGAPTFTPTGAVAAVVSNALLLVKCSETPWQARRYLFVQQRWETMTLPDLAPMTNAPLAVGLPDGLVLLGGSTNGGVGLAYEATSAQWRNLTTQEWPALNWQEARGVALPDGCLMLGIGPSGLQMSRYHSAAGLWENLSTNGFNLAWSPNLCSLWTGAEWYWMENRPAGWRGVRYHLASNLWSALPLEGAPAGHANARCLWTGEELMVVNLAVPPAEGVIPSALYAPQTGHWRPMTTAAPWSPFGPPPNLVVTGEEVLLVQVSDPSKYAAYHLTQDRWRPLTGPALGFEAFLQWTGRQLLALPVAPPAEMEHLLYRYTPPAPVGLFQPPAP